MKILGLIPARGGSKGVPGKNQKLLAGKPLICYSIETALACKALDTVAVSTDDEKIAGLSREAGAAVPFIRPSALATDDSPTIDTVIHALSFYEGQGVQYDAICLLQPTTPMRTTLDISRAIEIFQLRNSDSLISVREVPHHYNPHWVFEVQEGGELIKTAIEGERLITRRQDLPKAYHRDGAIYITRTEVVKEMNSLLGKTIAWYQSTNPLHINIDTEADWAEAERLIGEAEKDG